LTEILWTSYQEAHIFVRHGVSDQDFMEAWGAREDFGGGDDPDYGPYTESVGCTLDDRVIEMIWRWQDDDVWPITAYFVSIEER